MQSYDAATQKLITEFARNFGVSDEAVAAMLEAVRRGQGSMAQFNIPELGGGGQWMLGGMTMVGDMFNHGLKATVDQLCLALSQALQNGQIPAHAAAHGTSAWPAELGTPSSVGGQNDSAYAVFPSTRRLAIREGGRLTVYDTGDHTIFGVGQQQGGNASLTFTSQYGSFSVAGLRRVDAPEAESGGHGERSAATVGSQGHGSFQDQYQGAAPFSGQSQSQSQGAGPFGFARDQSAARPSWSEPTAKQAPDTADEPTHSPEPTTSPIEPPPVAATQPTAPGAAPSVDGLQIITLIEKLAALRQAGVLTDEEFSAKKAELLARL
ncbi:SHOCT domain-containing protein [Rhizobium sp. YIM 134829]|uniref:SHOCT domain-containing protein n=1 Tax=Rhizobium sp. YIM 134829 TaxID=3390453 RepID=UPI00397869A4